MPFLSYSVFFCFISSSVSSVPSKILSHHIATNSSSCSTISQSIVSIIRGCVALCVYQSIYSTASINDVPGSTMLNRALYGYHTLSVYVNRHAMGPGVYQCWNIH